MSETRMGCSGKDKFCESKLLDSTKPLELPAMNQIQQQPVQWLIVESDQIMDGIPNVFRPMARHGMHLT